MSFSTTDERSPPGQRSLWTSMRLLAPGFGVVIGFYESLPRVSGFGAATLPELLTGAIPITLCAALIVPVAFWSARTFPLFPQVRRRAMIVHLAAGLASAGLLLVIAASLRFMLLVELNGVPGSLRGAAGYYLPYYHILFVCYWTIVSACSIADYQRELRQRDREQRDLRAVASRARLESLRRRLHPHFLFNVLGAVSGLVLEGDRRRAVHALSDVSQLLRICFARDEALISLREELAFLDLFVHLHRLRLGERVRLETRVDPSALDLQVPTFLLQPLVENAIQHGVALLEDGGTITVEARVHDEQLIITLTNPISPSTLGRNGPVGIGLATTRERVSLACPGRGTFDFTITGDRAVARARLALGPDFDGELEAEVDSNVVQSTSFAAEFSPDYC